MLRMLAIKKVSGTVAAICLSLLLAPASAYPVSESTPQILMLTPSLDGESTAGFSEYLEVRPEEKIEPEEIIQGKYDSKFKPLPLSSVNRGLTQSTYWLRFDSANVTSKPLDTIFITNNLDADYIDLYVLRAGTAPEIIKIGDQERRDTGGYDYFTPAASLKTYPGEKLIIYVRMARIGDGVINLDLKAWDRLKFESYSTDVKFLLGAFYGVMAVMFLFNIFIYFSIRERAFLIYCLYVVFIMLTWASLNQLDGYYLWPENRWLLAHAPKLLVPIAVFVAAVFAREMLQSKARSRVEDTILKFVMITSIPAILVALTADYNSYSGITAHLSAANVMLLLGAGVLAYFAGYKPARFYVLAIAVMKLGVVAYILRDFGLVPITGMSTFMGQFGTGLEVALLSFALADKINFLREKKEEAERQALEAMSRHAGELEEKVAERTKQLMIEKERAEEATRIKDKFVSLVSHDLKSPLGGIIGYAQLLTKMQVDRTQSAKYSELVGGLLNSSEAMLRLITQVLDISRLSSGRIELRRNVFELKQLVEEKIRTLRPSADKKGIVIKNDVPEEIEFFADEILIGEVVGNLIANAIKFCRPADTVTVSITDTNGVELAVTDTGIGIPKTILPDIFKHEVKTTTKGTAGEDGTGLGLPYSMDIVEAHGATMRVESEFGKGATFYIKIPKPGRIILIADDQEAHARIMSEIITKKFRDVTTIHVENGFEVIDELTRFRPQVIITDLHMPKMGGLKLIETVKNSANFSSIPIIASGAEGSCDVYGESGMTFGDLRAKVISLGAEAFITKPVIESEFTRIMERYL